MNQKDTPLGISIGPTKVNLGSHVNPMLGWLNVDIDGNFPGVGLVYDLTKVPWEPFEDEQFDEVRAVDVLEHLGGTTKLAAVAELARITKQGGRVEVRVPNSKHHWAWASLQHEHAFQYNSFEESYAQPWFRVERMEVQFNDNGRRWKFNRFFRYLCKKGKVWVITFYLVKK